MGIWKFSLFFHVGVEIEKVKALKFSFVPRLHLPKREREHTKSILIYMYLENEYDLLKMHYVSDGTVN